jgi:hypothetical protein
MIKRQIYVTSLALVLFMACNDNDNKEAKPAPVSVTPAKDTSGYNFPIPNGWGTERIVFPIDFAPQITYTGVEELRFTPGWGMSSSDEYWSYSFLWWLDGNPAIDETVLAGNLKAYYTGLVGRNVAPRSIPPSKVIPVVTSFKKGDQDTYTGTITMTDYMNTMFNPITLNGKIYKKNCGAHTALIVTLSPKPFDHTVWQAFNKLQEGFTCVK